ncbi:MAG: asparagine synthase-related protein [Saprospiraceae bacterium]
MGAFLFYKTFTKSKLKDCKVLNESFSVLHSMYDAALLYDSNFDEDYLHFQNSEVDLYILGNFTQYRDFKIDLDSLYFNGAVQADVLDEVFRKFNGLFCAFLFDKNGNNWYLFTDHLGFYPVYYYSDSEVLLISSEIKYFNTLRRSRLHINREALFSYLENGHLILDQSWYKEVSRMRPASIYHWSNNDARLTHSYFWSWEKVKKLSLSKEVQIQKYIELFTSGISNLKFESSASLGISLSGGLDSRWIAQLATGFFPMEAFTFATGNNKEALLASKVAKELGIKHHLFDIEVKDWLQNRLDSFWKVDGLLHLGHLHEGNLQSQWRSKYSHIFHGFYGGGIYSNSYELNKRITEDIGFRHFKSVAQNLKTEDSFYDTQSIDPYIVDQKIRNQSAHSIYLMSSYAKIVIPFYNMEWLEFNYSIDDKLQLNSKFYLEVLNSSLSKNLLDIAWQKTGIPPSRISANVRSLNFRIPSIVERLFQISKSSKHFINYNLFDQEIDFWIQEFTRDILDLDFRYSLHNRERKLRMLSLVLILKMLSKNNSNVL